MVAGNVSVWPGASFAGNGIIGGSLGLRAGSTFRQGRSERRKPAAGRRHCDVVRRYTRHRLCRRRPAAGQRWRSFGAAGGINGRFSAVTEPTSGLADGTRIDTLTPATRSHWS